MFDSISHPDERARALAVAVRELDLEYRALRLRVVQRAGLSFAEFDAVLAVAEHDAMTPKRLAEAVNLTTSATTALLDRLTASGMLRREPHERDRRSVVVVLTPRAQQLVSGLFGDYVGRFERVLRTAPCCDSRLDDLIASLGCLAAALADRSGEPPVAISA